MILESKRLILRQWKESDRDPFYVMNSNPMVMKTMGGVYTRKLSDQIFDRMQSVIADNGWGSFAVELKEVRGLIGMVGLQKSEFPHPCIELLWRLDSCFWGKGYATEAAQLSMDYGFEKLGLEELVAFTAADNLASIAVMKRLGMVADPRRDFDHPKFEKGHPLCRHVFYARKRF